jgi:hypothetical protein
VLRLLLSLKCSSLIAKIPICLSKIYSTNLYVMQNNCFFILLLLLSNDCTTKVTFHECPFNFSFTNIIWETLFWRNNTSRVISIKLVMRFLLTLVCSSHCTRNSICHITTLVKHRTRISSLILLVSWIPLYFS